MEQVSLGQPVPTGLSGVSKLPCLEEEGGHKTISAVRMCLSLKKTSHMIWVHPGSLMGSVSYWKTRMVS